jgi:hypothetical protein
MKKSQEEKMLHLAIKEIQKILNERISKIACHVVSA